MFMTLSICMQIKEKKKLSWECVRVCDARLCSFTEGNAFWTNLLPGLLLYKAVQTETPVHAWIGFYRAWSFKHK